VPGWAGVGLAQAFTVWNLAFGGRSRVAAVHLRVAHAVLRFTPTGATLSIPDPHQTFSHLASR
jgi:hypothetical protein